MSNVSGTSNNNRGRSGGGRKALAAAAKNLIPSHYQNNNTKVFDDYGEQMNIRESTSATYLLANCTDNSFNCAGPQLFSYPYPTISTSTTSTIPVGKSSVTNNSDSEEEFSEYEEREEDVYYECIPGHVDLRDGLPCISSANSAQLPAGNTDQQNDWQDETFCGNAWALIESVSSTEPFLDVLIFYIVSVLLVDPVNMSALGFPFDYSLITLYHFHSASGFISIPSTASPTYLGSFKQFLGCNQWLVFDLSLIFAVYLFLFVTGFNAACVATFTIYTYVLFRYRGPSGISLALSCLLTLMDINVRFYFYESAANNYYTASACVVAINSSLHLAHRFVYGKYLHYYDYKRMVGGYCDSVYGQLDVKIEFIKFLHLPIIKQILGIRSNNAGEPSEIEVNKRQDQNDDDLSNNINNNNDDENDVDSEAVSVQKSIWQKAKDYALKVAIESEPVIRGNKYTPNLVFPIPFGVLKFSNELQREDRFELCVEKVECETVWVSWLIPRSLLMTLSSPFSAPPSDNAGGNTRMPLAFIQGSFQDSSPNNGSTNSKELSKDKLVYTHIEGEFGVLTSEVLLYVNGAQYSAVDVHLPKKILRIRNLTADTGYKFVMSILGYLSVPLNVMTLRKPSVLPVQEQAAVSVHTCQEQQSLHKHLTKRAELISAIDDEKAKKKDHQSLMKKMRKDHSKHLVAVKAEMEQLKRSVNKDEIHQAKMISRIPVLHDSIKTAKRSIDSLKRDLDGEENMKQSIGVELDSLSARWQGDREEVERLESMLKLQKSENDAVIEEISEELSQLTRKAGEQHEKLMFLDHESRDVEKKITELDVLVKDEKANGSQLDKRLKEETKHLTRIVSDSDARNALIQENIARMERERAHITQQLEFERNELVQLDSELMMKRNPPYYGHTSGNFSFYNNKNTNNTNKSGN